MGVSVWVTVFRVCVCVYMCSANGNLPCCECVCM